MPKLDHTRSRRRPLRVAGQVRRINDAEQIAQSLGEEFFEDALSDMEIRAQLQEAGQVAAEIIIELESAGPLGRYAAARRAEAAEALRILVEDTDPKDAVAVSEAQAQVREYLRLCRWVRGKQDQAAHAEAIINEQYGPDAQAAE